MNLMFGPGDQPVSGQMLGPATASTIAPVSPALDDEFWTTNAGNLYGVGANTAGTDTYLVRFASQRHAGRSMGLRATAPQWRRQRRRVEPGH